MITKYLKICVWVLLAILSPICATAQRGLYIGENVPITFYGKVVDQYAQPIPKAKVSLEVVITHYAVNSGEQKDMTLETDRNGEFIVTEINGHAIDKILIDKKGYELSAKTQRGYLFSFGNVHKPDATSPVIFKMWKKQGKEHLEHSAWRGKVACDGTTNHFDLMSGRPSPEGNLEIVCTRVPLNLPPANTKPFTWGVQITIIGGVIKPTDDEFTYLAPETNYLSSLTYGQRVDDPKWNRDMPMPKDYYIKTPDGHYGVLSLEWDRAFWKSPTILKWECFVNPSGSRNLER